MSEAISDQTVANNSISIRQASRADAPIIIELITALANFESIPVPDDTALERLINDGFGDRPRFDVFLAEVGDKVAGYIFVFETYSTILAKPTLYLEDLFVRPEFQGYKVGYALFQFCIEEARRRGCGRLDWQVLDWNTHAIKFYERQGATRLSEWLPYRIVL